MSNLGIGVSTNASYTSGGAINSSPFAASGTIHGGNWSGNTASANGSSSGAFLYQNKVQATTMAISMKFDVQTSTTGTTTRYIYPWGGLAGVTVPGMNFGVTVQGLIR